LVRKPVISESSRENKRKAQAEYNAKKGRLVTALCLMRKRVAKCLTGTLKPFGRAFPKGVKRKRSDGAAYYRTLRATNPRFAIAHRLRSRLLVALKKKRSAKLSGTEVLLGCTINKLMDYLESLFQPGMNWGNRHLWEIDHKKAITKFDLSSLEGQMKACHYTNLQPMWTMDNRRKGDRY
jgi:hypothetical protein